MIMKHTVTWIQTDGPHAGEIQTQDHTTELEAAQHRESINLYTNTYLVDADGCIEGQPAEEWYRAVFGEPREEFWAGALKRERRTFQGGDQD